ncbi:MAG: phytoene desaturase family protein [Planctomycetota bacterium]|nr:phytoene desaturase family protein [Planctomycetota bacterium]
MTAPSSKRVVVVGAGPGGLAAAAELAALGFQVDLVEKNAHLGGKLNVCSEGGFTFDMGPTIITLPQVLTGIFERAGRRPSDYVELVNLDPQWRCFYEDGVVLDLVRDVDRMAARLDQQFPLERPGEGYRAIVEFSRRMMRLSGKVFFFRDLGGVADLIFRERPKDPDVARDALAMRMHSTVAGTIHAKVSEPHVRQMCEHFLQYVGSSPFLAPAILTLIASAQVDHGCWYPMGGTRMVARSLERLCGELGVRFHLGTGVKQIHVGPAGAGRSRGGKQLQVLGVELNDGTQLPADAVVSNCDVQRTYRDLIARPEAIDAQRKIGARYKPACSGVVLYLGLDRRYEHLAHHNFLFSRDSHSEFDDIYHKNIPARDPTLYIAAPSRTDPDQAPSGGEALYILVHTAAIQQNTPSWTAPGGLMDQYTPVIMDKLRRFGMKDVDERIVVKRTLSPAGIRELYNAEGGAIYGLASHGRLHGGFKPRNRSDVYGGLYLCGGSVNPGPGVPMALMSGVTAARALAEDAGVDVKPVALGSPLAFQPSQSAASSSLAPDQLAAAPS